MTKVSPKRKKFLEVQHLRKAVIVFSFSFVIMHQSIIAVPMPLRDTAGHLLALLALGWGSRNFYRGPGTGH